ncbi:WapI family immunity protein [Bacillus mycoides]|uniref:WapI family immunity protein n=1 Tax=Bacillus mycoides TaxID=1405 RepID=UPI003F74C888
MECFHIGEDDDNFIKIVITDFSSEGDSYFGGAYFKGECELGCTGFKVKTTSFYFDNNDIYHFYKDLQKIYTLGSGTVHFKSESNELSLTCHLDIGASFKISVRFKELEGDSTLSCYIYECYEYIPSIKSQLTSFLDTFKFNGDEWK